MNNVARFSIFDLEEEDLVPVMTDLLEVTVDAWTSDTKAAGVSVDVPERFNNGWPVLVFYGDNQTIAAHVNIAETTTGKTIYIVDLPVELFTEGQKVVVAKIVKEGEPTNGAS